MRYLLALTMAIIFSCSVMAQVITKNNDGTFSQVITTEAIPIAQKQAHCDALIKRAADLKVQADQCTVEITAINAAPVGTPTDVSSAVITP